MGNVGAAISHDSGGKYWNPPGIADSPLVCQIKGLAENAFASFVAPAGQLPLSFSDRALLSHFDLIVGRGEGVAA